MLGGLSGLCDTVLFFFPASIVVFRTLLVLECLFPAMPLPLLTAYLLHYCEENLRTSKLFRTALVLWTIYFAMDISGLFTDAFFYILPDKNYSRGPWFPLMLLPMLAIAILDLAGVIQRRKRFSRTVFRSFLIALVPLTGVLFVHMFVDVVVLVDICYIIFAYPMFNFILYDQIEQDLRRQREMAEQQHEIAEQQLEIANQRASIMVLQMRPHTWFRIPPLTLQPIVENAIKHGRDPYAGLFCISIQTRKTDSGAEIVVADNGRGFNPDNGGEPHIALKNIQQRLALICGGSLTIKPNDGGGTVVTVTIPDSTVE